MRAALADGREAWRALDQAGARETLALTGEQQRTAAVLAGVHACITEITSTPTDLGTDAAAAAENARGRQLAELDERAQQLQARGARIAERLDALCARDATPERWARRTHARSCRASLPARSSTRANSPKGSRAGAHVHASTPRRARQRPLIPEHPATDADPYAEARAAFALAAAARPPATRAKSASLPVAVPARPVRTTGAARSPRPHR